MYAFYISAKNKFTKNKKKCWLMKFRKREIIRKFYFSFTKFQYFWLGYFNEK